ncbi:TnsA-like heteromeric transposase endonuclease subunit [Mycobacterium sp. DBP42]|uniref:TnsA-like heteromeric transposase endonuclease subunit n=1 Tax=Mycobacterium sp. DBP42 TaxID=2545267 RepID=UPI002016D38E|nr:TnsA-like heteromeric transposase endonuclease subunit [Mycobacterium sp. DBP42]
MSASVDVDVGSAVLEYRLADGQSLAKEARRTAVAALFDADPWRTFSWHLGQRHYSGNYWSATEGDHVIYESRLELSALLMADFDPAVSRIKAQPFLLTALVGPHRRRHITDYLLQRDAGLVVIDVVRAARLHDPKIASLCMWTKRVIESLGWSYEVISEQPPVLLANVRFLAGYRRPRFIDSDAVAYLRLCAPDLAGMRIDDAESQVGKHLPIPVVRSALLHLLWRQEFVIDLTEQLRPSTVLEIPT